MTNYTERQKEIINASMRIISQKGIDYLTISTLAKSINVTEGALYKHFKNKQEIINGVVDYIDSRIEEVIDFVEGSNLSGMELLRSFFISHFHMITQYPEQIMLIHSYSTFLGDRPLHDKINQAVDKYKDTWISIIKRCQDHNELDSKLDSWNLFLIIIGTLYVILANWQRMNKNFDIIKEAERLWNTMELLLKRSTNSK